MERTVKSSTEKMRRNFDRIGRGISEISRTARWGFLGMTAAIAGVTYMAQKQEKAVAKLVQQMENHGEATEENISALTGLASALQKTTQFGDEQIIAGQAMLASFNLTTQQIKELTPHLLNLAIMTENTTGQQADLASVAKMVGVALGGQAGRLVQMGIAITDTQREMLKMADAEEKINILMQIFQENAGGLAEATGKTLAGSLSKAKNAMGDLAEELGFLLSPVIIKASEAIVAKVSEWKEAIRALTPEQKKLIAQIVFLGTAALGAIGALSLFSTVARLVVAAGNIIAGVIGLIASPLGLIVLAVAALAIAWAYNWGDIQGKTKAAWDFLKPILKGIIDGIKGLEETSGESTEGIRKQTEEQKSIWAKLGTILIAYFKAIGMGIWDIVIGIGKIFGLTGEKIKEGFKVVFTQGLWWVELFQKAIGGLWERIGPWLKVKFEWVLERVGAGWLAFTEFLINAGPWIEQSFYWMLERIGEGWDWFKEIMQWVKEHAMFSFNWMLDKAYAGWIWLEEKLWPWVKEWAVNTYKWGLNLIGDFIGWFRDTLIPWVKEWKEKTFKWTLNLFGDAWQKIKDIGEWLKAIPDKLKPVKEGMQEVAKASEKIISPKASKDLSHLDGVLKGIILDLEDSIRNWGKATQVIKSKIAAQCATFILLKHGITDLAGKLPLEFAEKFSRGFMRAKPEIQKAILSALTARDFQKALALAGTEAGEAFLYGHSPGGILGELEEGQGALKDNLDKMIGKMDAMTKKMAKIFQPIIGLFKKIFEGVIAVIKKFDEEAGMELETFVNDVMTMIEGLFDYTAEEKKEDTEDTEENLEEQESAWKKFCRNVKEYIGNAFKRMAEAAKEYFSKMENWLTELLNQFTAVIKGEKDMTEALWDFIAAIPGIGTLAVAIKNFAEAFIGWINNLIWGQRELSETEKAVKRLGGTIEEAFENLGMQLHETIESAKSDLESLIQKQTDLEANTRDKLIRELDKYYDYRKLREMDLTELLELAAKTREKIEKGTIESIAETDEEAKVREKDNAISALNTITEAYEKEQKLLDQKILLLQAEIALLEYKLYLGNAELRKGNWREKANEALERATNLMDEYNEKYGENIEKVREAEEATEALRDEIDKIPSKIAFDIIGNLKMPSIPGISTQYFDIVGKYTAPYIELPKFQTGIFDVPHTMPAIIHRKEAVLTAPQAEEWRADKGGADGGTKVVYERGAIRMTVMGSINQQVDLEEAMDYLAKKQTNIMRRV